MTFPKGAVSKVSKLSKVETPKRERRTSKVIVTIVHGEGLVLLCEESVALDFVREAGCGAGIDGFSLEQAGVGLEKCETPGVYVGELRIIDAGPESWEMPHIRDYYAEVHKLRPITREEWQSHLADEWPEGFHCPNGPEVPYDPARERLVPADGVDRPCALHPAPSTLNEIICRECGACKMTGHPFVYIERLV